MARRASVVLRDQFEIAKRHAELQGTMTSVDDVRGKVTLALSIVKEKLRPIDQAAARNDLAWLVRIYPDWNAERLLLGDEVRELDRLLAHVDLFLCAPVDDRHR